MAHGRGASRVSATADSVAPRALDTAAVDSSLIFRTDAGRIVIGGGGIRPDLLVPPDTLTTTEREFLRALGGKLPVYQDVMTTYALELKGADVVRNRNFQVTAAMRMELLRQMREREIELTDEVFAGAQQLVDQQFSYEVQRYVFGREAETRRRMRDDAQVQRALALLRQANSVSELFTLAEQSGEAQRTP